MCVNFLSNFNYFITMNNKTGLAVVALLGGALIGGTLGLLFAPDTGERQRRKIKVALERHGVKLAKEEFNKLVDELKNICKKDEVDDDPAADYDVE